MKILTPDAIELIKSNGPLYGEVAKLVGVSPISLKDMIIKNADERLAKPEVIIAIKSHLAGMQDMQIIENAKLVA